MPSDAKKRKDAKKKEAAKQRGQKKTQKEEETNGEENGVENGVAENGSGKISLGQAQLTTISNTQIILNKRK